MSRSLKIKSYIQDQTTMHLFLLNRKRADRHFLAITVSECVLAETSKWVAKEVLHRCRVCKSREEVDRRPANAAGILPS